VREAVFGVHPNWKVFAIGAAMAGIGKWAYDAAVNSPFLNANFPYIARWLSGAIPVFEAMVILGIILAVFGLFWRKWVLAILIGSALALLVFFVSFAR